MKSSYLPDGPGQITLGNDVPKVLPDLATLLPPRALAARDERDKLVTEAHLSYGHTLKEIADHPHLHYAPISEGSEKDDGDKCMVARPDPTGRALG